MALARSLTPPVVLPAQRFREELRGRLVFEAAARDVASAAPVARVGPRAVRSIGSSRVRLVAAGTAMSLAVSAGAVVASTSALPGDPLYGLKRQVEGVELALSMSDLGRGRDLLQQAETRLTEAEQLARSDRPATQREQVLGTVFASWADAMTTAQSTLFESYEETGDDEPMVALAESATEQAARLRALRGEVPPSLRESVDAAVTLLTSLRYESAALIAVGRGSNSLDLAVGQALASGDGWAVSRLVERLPPSAPSGGSAAAGGGGAGGDGEASGVLVSSPLDGASGEGSGLTDTSATGSTGTSPMPSPGAATGSVVGSTTAPAAPPTAESPSPAAQTSVSLPSVSLSPTTTTLPTSSTSPLPEPTLTSGTSPLPEPTLTSATSIPLPSQTLLPTACVPVPPLTTCP